MLRVGDLLRVITVIIVLLVGSMTVLAYASPISPKPSLLQIGVARIVDVVAEGCGAGWHWSNRRGWNWGRCVRDWHP
jgi:hypothetical protein